MEKNTLYVSRALKIQEDALEESYFVSLEATLKQYAPSLDFPQKRLLRTLHLRTSARGHKSGPSAFQACIENFIKGVPYTEVLGEDAFCSQMLLPYLPFPPVEEIDISEMKSIDDQEKMKRMLVEAYQKSGLEIPLITEKPSQT